MAAVTPTLPAYLLRPLSPPACDSTFSATIIDSPGHCLPRSSSRIPLMTHQKSSLQLDAIDCSDALHLNVSPIRLGAPDTTTTTTTTTTKAVPSTEHSISAELSGSKLDTTYTDMVVVALVQKKATRSSCKRKRKVLEEEFSSTHSHTKPVQSGAQMLLAATKVNTGAPGAVPTPQATALVTPPHSEQASPQMQTNRKPSRLCSRVASIRRCKSCSVDHRAVVVNAEVHLRHLRRQKSRSSKATETPQPSGHVDTTLDITAKDSRTWSAKRRKLSLDADG